MEGLGGEEIERALMDLGPLLGVSIKEEAPDEATGDATSAQPNNVVGRSSSTEGAGAEKSGADSLQSPAAGAGGAGAGAARCVLCGAALAQTDGTPKLMECLHSACEPCLKAKLEEKLASGRDFLGAERMTITCPVCRLQCQPANMIDQRFVLEKIALDNGNNGAVSSEQQCNSCEESEPATSYCTDCAEFICDNCVQAHQRLKITKDHTIKSKESAVLELSGAGSGGGCGSELSCGEHPGERLALFCETCDRLTCRDCQLQHHRDHKYQFSTEMAAQARANISSLLSEVSYKRVLLGSAMKVIKDRQQLIADKKKALVHEITATVVKLTNAINSRGKQLVLRLSEVCDAKLRTLADKKEALEQLAAITDHCTTFVNSALEQGSDTAVLYSKRAVCAHLQRIKSRRADIPNPEIPVRIALALDKMPDLMRVLSTIGAIVVDGKVDGGSGGNGGGGNSGGGGGGGSGGGSSGGSGGGAQGPYHPPHGTQHSAVVALQHAAMHQFGAQSYVQSVGGVGGVGAGYMGAVGGVGGVGARARHHTPLRHPHVTSTTHPHHLHGMGELNLRGLLTPPRNRALLPSQHHSYQHPLLSGFASAAYNAPSGVVGGLAGGVGGGAAGGGGRGARTPSPAPPLYHHPHHQQQHHQQHVQHPPTPPHHAKWHIPQHNIPNGGGEANMSVGAEFKITLGRSPRPPLVSSTNRSTPSPSPGLQLQSVGGAMELDKVCAESVQDLMATIAKLDSNGVQVVAEGGAGAAGVGGAAGGASAGAAHAAPSPAPAVHSSTEHDHYHAKSGMTSGGDPNEDWCAVCMDGGELMCCDKCPKVFHQYCHIPTIEKLPDETETWQCLLCVNFAELADEGGGSSGTLSARQQKLIERITLELYCQYEPSLPFREPVAQDNHHYHSKISRPMCLDMIRMKLQPRAGGYSTPAHFVADVRLMFRNAYHYNPPDSQIYKDAKRLEEFFDLQLVKWLPELAYWSGDGDPPPKRPRI